VHEKAPPSGRGVPNSGDATPASAQGTPPFRGRRRKLQLGVAALGVLLAVLVGFLLASAGGRDDSVRIDFAGVFTNEVIKSVMATFSVTNAGENVVQLETLVSQIKSNGQWSYFDEAKGNNLQFPPDQSTNLSMVVPHDGRVWRARAIWFTEPTRFQRWRFKLRVKATSIFAGSKPAPFLWLEWNRHTNHSPEFPR